MFMFAVSFTLYYCIKFYAVFILSGWCVCELWNGHGNLWFKLIIT